MSIYQVERFIEAAVTILPHCTEKQCEEFVESLSSKERERYERIHNISNQEAIVFEMKRIGLQRETVRESRYRFEEE